MDPRIEAVITDYEVRSQRESALMSGPAEQVQAHRDELLLPIGPESAQILSILIKAQGAKTIVEVGASYGYSTVWFAEAARATGGRLISFELQASKVDYARAQLERAGLSEVVEFRIGDAVDRLGQLQGPVDFALIDLWKDLYIPCFDLLLPRLAAGAFVVADNMLLPPSVRRHAERYQQHVRSTGRFDSVLLPVGGGLEISRLRD